MGGYSGPPALLTVPLPATTTCPLMQLEAARPCTLPSLASRPGACFPADVRRAVSLHPHCRLLQPFSLVPSSPLGSDIRASPHSAPTYVPGTAGVGKGTLEEAGQSGAPTIGRFRPDKQEGEGHSGCKRGRSQTPDLYNHEPQKNIT